MQCRACTTFTTCCFTAATSSRPFVSTAAPLPCVYKRSGCLVFLLLLLLLLGLGHQLLQWRPDLAAQLQGALQPLRETVQPLLEHEQVCGGACGCIVGGGGQQQHTARQLACSAPSSAAMDGKHRALELCSAA